MQVMLPIGNIEQISEMPVEVSEMTRSETGSLAETA